ncbi:MAG: chaperone NapD [Alphaproteobacteria bacterium]|nr:chaperone NapD [Alphaproteobacteria bacterium]MDP6832479.1 chaperone NapD [Alphaproteobacteria bacterium]MDP6875331.1 chaperone NapD [Alphaproteobacteria bacterium]
MATKPEAPAEFNICGVFVETTPNRLQAVARTLAETPGIDIHQTADDGRLVVTIEDTPDKFASETLTSLRSVDGVLSASLVYHHCDSEAKMLEEITS